MIWHQEHIAHGDFSLSGELELTKIPRYATSVQSLKSKTVNSITINWSSDSTVDYIWYSKDNGSNWTGINITDGKSGSYTISGLSPNTAYKIKTRVRRKDSQLTTDSSATSITTYNIAKITTAPNINIGSSHTIKWTNPSGASISLKLCKTDNTQVIDYGTVTGTSKSITPTASTIYKLIPKANSITLRYVITTTVNGTSYTHYKNVVFTVTNSNPTFSNCTYEDRGSVSTVLTGNNQTVINGYNSLYVNISTANKAVAKNSATMSKYRLVCGNQSVEASYSSSADVTLKLNHVTSMTFVVYAIDSRGNSTAVTKSVTTWKNYFNPAITAGVAERTEQVNEAVQLTFSGKIWNGNFGAEQNAIKTCTYKYKKTSASSYTTGTTKIVPTISGNTFSASLLIEGDSGANGFKISNSYNIQITLADRIRTITYDIILSAGTPAMAIGQSGVCFGGAYDETAGGLIQLLVSQYLANGKSGINLRNSDVINANGIYMNDEATGKEGINFLKQNGDTTNPDDYECLRGYRGNVYYNDKKLIFESEAIRNSLTLLTDCNDTSLATGIYRCNGDTLNTPFSSSWTLVVLKIASTSITHVIRRYRDNEMYIRHYNTVTETSWKDWVLIPADFGIKSVTSFSNSWVNYGGNYEDAKYKKIGKVVYLQGLIKNGTSGKTAFTLPSGYRPAYTKIFASVCPAGFAEVRVDSSGNVIPYCDAANGYVCLDGINFLIT